MAELTGTQRAQLTSALMKAYSAYNEEVPILKADLRAGVDALDTWLNSNAATINSTLPTPARTGLTTPQKAVLFSGVQIARYIVDNLEAIGELTYLVNKAQEELT
jgi:hypothetical protein